MSVLIREANTLEKDVKKAEIAQSSFIVHQSQNTFPSSYPSQPSGSQHPSYRTQFQQIAFLADREAQFEALRRKLLVIDLTKAAQEEDDLKHARASRFLPRKIQRGSTIRFLPPLSLVQRIIQHSPGLSKESICQFLFEFENNRIVSAQKIKKKNNKKSVKILDSIDMMDFSQVDAEMEAAGEPVDTSEKIDGTLVSSSSSSSSSSTTAFTSASSSSSSSSLSVASFSITGVQTPAGQHIAGRLGDFSTTSSASSCPPFGNQLLASSPTYLSTIAKNLNKRGHSEVSGVPPELSKKKKRNKAHWSKEKENLKAKKQKLRMEQGKQKEKGREESKDENVDQKQ